MKIVVFLQNSLFHDDFDAESDNVASSAETMRARAAYISAVSTSKVIKSIFGLYIDIWPRQPVYKKTGSESGFLVQDLSQVLKQDRATCSV